MKNYVRSGGIVALAALLALTLSGCFGVGSHAGSAANVGVRFTGSIFSGGKADGCIQPGQRITTTDHVYYLPGLGNERQDQWETGNSAADHSDLTITSKDGVAMTMQLNENFGMTSDCATLTKFMQTIGLTRKAYFNADSTYLPGWITAMNYYISPVVVKRVQSEISQYTAAQLWPSTKLYDVIAKAVDGADDSNGNNVVENAVASTTNNNHFYTNMSTDVYKIQPNSDYQATIQARVEAKQKAVTTQLNAKSAVTQAQAQAKIARAQASVTQANISAFGKGPQAQLAYLKSLIIANGGNPFQPQYIVGGTTPPVQAPQSSQ